MAEDTEIDEKELAILRETLIELKTELIRLIDGAAENTKPVELDKPIGRVTRIDEIQQQSMAKASREANRQRLKAVESSLAAMEKDEYGACRSCGEIIGLARLKARPESFFCRDCQEDRERR